MTLTRCTFATGLGAGLIAAPHIVHAAGVDLSKVTLRIGDQVGQNQSKLKAAGLLDDVPYKIEWSVYPAAVQLHEALKAGAIDIGAASDSPTVSAIAGGSKIRVVSAWGNGGRGTRLYVPKNSPAKTVADLAGKTISPTTRGSVSHYLVIGELAKAGLKESDVKLAFLNPVDAGAAFGAGSIDAWATWGVYGARIRSALGAKVLSDGAGINSGLLIYAATQSAIDDPGKLAAIADYSNRVERGNKWGRDHRDAYVAWYRAFAKQDEAIARELADDDLAYRRLAIDGDVTAGLKKTFDTWKTAGILNGDIDFNAILYRDLAIGA